MSKIWIQYRQIFALNWCFSPIVYYLWLKICLYYCLCSRFQKRLTLYVYLASWLLDNGMQAHEPVGVHPSLVWCYETDHPESLICPVHAAVESGQLLILKMFLSRNILNLACRDPINRNLLQIAIHHRHKKCVSHLVSKLYTMVIFRGFALST